MSKKPRISYRDFGRLTPPISQPATPAQPAPSAQPAQQTPRARPADVRRTLMLTPRSVAAALDASAPGVSLRSRIRTREGTADLLLFHVGRELFALELGRVEEAVDIPAVQQLPEMSRAMLGVFTLRNALVALYASDPLLGVKCAATETALVLQGNGRRVALAIDDVDDVLTVNLDGVQDAPAVAAADGLVLGMVRRARDLVTVLDADVLVSACRGEAALETT